jgi:hypothetical protein
MSHEEAWARNLASKVTGQRKTDCAVTRSEIFKLHGAQWLYCMFNLEGRKVGNVARMGQKRNSTCLWWGNMDESLGRPRRRQKDNIKINREEI